MRTRDCIFIFFLIASFSSGNGKTSKTSKTSKNSISPKWSTPEECIRKCTDDEPPRYCYYHLTIEHYDTMGSACSICRQNKTDQLLNVPKCQCIEADGVAKSVLSINRLIPGPSIQVCQHDMLIIDVENKAEALEVILHWHGILQNGSQYYDGVPMVTQCPITSGNTFRYQFPASIAGTYFYHSHLLTHRMDGQYASLIIRQTSSTDPNWNEYDEDLPTHIILVSDWMHHLSTDLYPGLYNTSGILADNLLINGRGAYRVPPRNLTDSQLETFHVEPGKRYRFRFINSFTTTCPAIITIENHDISIIAQDGDSTHPAPATSIRSASGERVDFVLTANQTVGSYWIQLRGLRDCANAKLQQLAILSYSGAPKKRRSPAPTFDNALPIGRLYNPPDGRCDKIMSDVLCVNQLLSTDPPNQRLTSGEPDERIILPFGFHSFNNDLKKLHAPNTYKKYLQPGGEIVVTAIINNISYIPPKMPLISQHPGPKDTCNSKRNTNNCGEVCYCTHVIDIKKNSIVEFVIYDEIPRPPLTHPFHLHGYGFTILKIGPSQTQKNISRNDIDKIVKVHQKVLKTGGYVEGLASKDTVMVPTGGYIIFRILADNPGWWFFHCHFDWHSATGMQVVIHVGEPEDLPPIPKNFPKCQAWKPPPKPVM